MTGRDIVQVTFYYDIVSPNSWFAFEVLLRYKKLWSATFDLKPVLLDAIRLSSGNYSSTIVPLKANYLQEYLRRVKDYFNVPFKPNPELSEHSSHKAQQLLTAVRISHPEKLVPLSRSLWQQVWSCEEDLSKEIVLRKALGSAGFTNHQSELLLGQIQDEIISKQLREATDEAINYGAYNTPALVVRNSRREELFLGPDQFPVMCHLFDLPWFGPDPERKENFDLQSNLQSSL